MGRSNVPPYKRQADMLFLPIFVNTGCPHFLKVHFLTTLSFQKIYIGTCFSLTKRNPEKISAFPKKRRKVKIEFGIFFCAQSRESGTIKLLPWKLHPTSQHPSAPALNCVCEHLCSASIYFCASVSEMHCQVNRFFALCLFGLQKVS